MDKEQIARRTEALSEELDRAIESGQFADMQILSFKYKELFKEWLKSNG